MSLTKSLFFITGASLLSGCIVVASPSHANHHIQQELVLDARQLNAFDVEAGAGSLVISGSEHASTITVVADIYTDKRNADNYELTLTDAGHSAFLVAKINSSHGFWQGDSPHIDIKVTIPSHMMLKVEDGSGAASINDIYGTVEVKDGSGELTIKGIKGSLDITDGSGSMHVSEIVGDVTIVDGSGKIELSNVDGNANIDDGSGSIVAKNILGNARFEDGSGDLTIKKVEGVITIDDGSGDIDVEQAGGLKILDSGSGGLRVKQVTGGFEIDS
ncbi:MAG: hypothetical protein WBC60_08400 [Cognaticolwellia sp.]